MNNLDKARRMFCKVVKLIDPKEHPLASRIVWKIPMKYFLDDVTPETYAGLIICDASFWYWYLRQESPMLKRDIGLARTIFSAMDDEDKIMSDEEVENDFYYQKLKGVNNND